MRAPVLFPDGVRINLQGQPYVSHGRGPGGRLKLEHTRLKSTKYFHPEVLEKLMCDGKAELCTIPGVPGPFELDSEADPVADLSTLPHEEQLMVQRRYAYVQGIRDRGIHKLSPNTLAIPIAQIAIELTDSWAGEPDDIVAAMAAIPSWRSVKRWIDSFGEMGLYGLISERRGNTTPRISPEVMKFIEEAVEQYYLQPQRETAKNTHGIVRGLVARENRLRPPARKLKEPSYNVLLDYIARLDKFEVVSRRYGKAYAERLFKAYGRGLEATRPLQVVQVDHHLMDVVVTWGGGKIVLGRAWLTTALDLCTRQIVGYCISFSPPSYTTVMRCLRHAILPKVLHKDRELAPLCQWRASGKIETLVVDNGKEFRGIDLRNAAAHLGMRLAFCPPRKPWFKGAMERWFGTLNLALVSSLPGHVISLLQGKGDFDATKLAVIDLHELDTILTKWIVDSYHQTPHRSLTSTPARRWEEVIQEWPTTLPYTENQVSTFLARSHKGTIQSYGIEWEGLEYNSTELARLRRHNGTHHVLFKYDPDDVSRIWVLDPLQKGYITVPCKFPEYAKGLSLFVHRIIRKRARENCANVVDWEALLESRLACAEYVQRFVERGKGGRNVARCLEGAPTQGKLPLSPPNVSTLLDETYNPEIDAKLADDDIASEAAAWELETV